MRNHFKIFILTICLATACRGNSAYAQNAMFFGQNTQVTVAPAIALHGTCTSGFGINSGGATVNLPVATTAGDFIVVALFQFNPVTPPAGYTQQYIDTPSSSSLEIFTHPFVGGDTTSPNFSFFTSNFYWVACSYQNVGGVESVSGTDSANSATSFIKSSAAGLTTTHANDFLIAIYAGTLFNGTPTSLTYPGSLVERQAQDSASAYLWFSDQAIPISGTATGTMTAITSQSIDSALGAQLILHP